VAPSKLTGNDTFVERKNYSGVFPSGYMHGKSVYSYLIGLTVYNESLCGYVD